MLYIIKMTNTATKLHFSGWSPVKERWCLYQ